MFLQLSSSFTPLKMQDPELVNQLKERLPEALFEKLNGSLSIDRDRLRFAEYKVRVLEERLRLVRIEKYGPDALPKSPLAKACNYTLTLWQRLTRFLDYPVLELSNNLAENPIRPVALGRRNWIHVGSKEAGPRVAAIISVVETCRRLKIPVRDYLGSVLPGLGIFQSVESPNLRPPPGQPETERPNSDPPPAVLFTRRIHTKASEALSSKSRSPAKPRRVRPLFSTIYCHRCYLRTRPVHLGKALGKNSLQMG